MDLRRSLPPVVLGALGALVLACHGAVPKGPNAPPPTSGPPRKVFLLSLDGASAGRLRQLYRDGKLTAGGFSRFFREGQVAERLIPVDPTLTSPNHISLATGYPPGQTGIVSNIFHPAGAPFLKTVSGFAAPIETETLWEAARRQGKRVGVNTWPGADDTGPRRRADWGMAYTNSPYRRAELLTVSTPGEAGVPTRVGSGPAAQTFDLALADGHLLVTPPGSTKAFPLVLGRWAELPCRVETRDAVCQVKLLEMKPGGTTHLYFSGVYPLPAYPQDFAAALAGEGLFWPGPPDDDRLEDTWKGRPGIDLETWLEQSDRFAHFFGQGLLAAVQRPDWDLLMGYMPVIDEVEHEMQLVDPRQPGFTPERRKTLEAARDKVWREADRELASLLKAVDLRTTVVAVVSDHGMAPVHTTLRLNVLLREKGLADDVQAVGDGGIVHVYVKPERADLLPALGELFTRWKVGDETPVERALTRREAAAVHLDHPNSGDLVLFLREGYMSENDSDGKAVAPTEVLGMHGYLASHPEVQGIYMAIGAGIPGGSVRAMRNLEVAGRVSAWLGIEPPRLRP